MLTNLVTNPTFNSPIVIIVTGLGLIIVASGLFILTEESNIKVRMTVAVPIIILFILGVSIFTYGLVVLFLV